MLKRQLLLAATSLISATAFAAEGEIKPIQVQLKVTYSFDVRADKTQSNSSTTVYNTQIHKTGDANHSVTKESIKMGRAETIISSEALKSATITAKPMGFNGQHTSITLNADGTAKTTGILDASEPIDHASYTKTENGFKIPGQSLQKMMDLLIEHDVVAHDSPLTILAQLFPNATENELKIKENLIGFKVVSDLECVKTKRSDLLNCTVSLVHQESGEILVNENTKATYEKAIEFMKMSAAKF